MNTTTFETARIGDRVWSVLKGWATVTVLHPQSMYPLEVEYDRGGRDAFTSNGYLFTTNKTQVLFWDAVKIEAPQKPLPELEVDTKVLVWGDSGRKQKRHFSHFSNCGRIYAFDNGSTSFTKMHAECVTGWPHWELAE